MLKPGGTLVYSTCTITPEENEAQVTWFLENFSEFELVKQVTCFIKVVTNSYLCEHLYIYRNHLLDTQDWDVTVRKFNDFGQVTSANILVLLTNL